MKQGWATTPVSVYDRQSAGPAATVAVITDRWWGGLGLDRYQSRLGPKASRGHDHQTSITGIPLHTIHRDPSPNVLSNHPHRAFQIILFESIDSSGETRVNHGQCAALLRRHSGQGRGFGVAAGQSEG